MVRLSSKWLQVLFSITMKFCWQIRRFVETPVKISMQELVLIGVGGFCLAMNNRLRYYVCDH